MTTFYDDVITCAVCGYKNTTTSIGSTNAFGSVDLDLRPPPMKRQTMSHWIHECDQCGFCSTDLENTSGLDVRRVSSDAYRAILTDDHYPALANTFRAHAFLAQHAGTIEVALNSMRCAAWACDDNAPAVAPECRKESLRLLDTLHLVGKSFLADKHTDDILRLDLLRRCGRFMETIALALAMKGESLSPDLKAIAAFQSQLARACDTGVYTVAHALERERNEAS